VLVGKGEGKMGKGYYVVLYENTKAALETISERGAVFLNPRAWEFIYPVLSTVYPFLYIAYSHNILTGTSINAGPWCVYTM
jgi:hypothetical protein